MGNSDDPKKWKPKIEEKLKQFSEEENSDYAEIIKSSHNMEVDEFITAIGTPSIFKQKFLIPHYKMYNILLSINEEITNISQKNLNEEEIEKEKNNLLQKKIDIADSKIEIFFCNAVDGSPKCLKCLANIFMKYGLVHTGLLIDDLVIQWGRGVLGKSIVNPSIKVRYDDYIYAIEVDNKKILELIKETFNNLDGYLTGKKNINEMGTIEAFNIANSQLDAIAEIATNYNKTKNYHLVFQNCQGFVNAIISKIKLNVNKKGEVGRVLKKVEDVCNVIDFEFQGQKFNTRQELDNYVINDAKFQELPKNDRRALFCYRNVFDYRLRERPTNKKYQLENNAQIYWRELLSKEKFEKDEESNCNC